MSAQQPQNAQQAQPPRSEKHLPGYQQTPKPQADPDALAQMSHDELETVMLRLMELDYGEDGLTRDQIRKRYRDLPEAVYLRMPSSRRFMNAEEAMRDALEARSRAEGEFLGAEPSIPDQESVGDGGPPAWGGDPLLTMDGTLEGGSAEDTAVLTVANTEESAQGDERVTDLDR
jgi:hypothetical protein